MTVQFLAPTKRKKISKKEAARLFLLHNGMCANCGLQIKSGERWFIEHVDALVLGGAETDDNRRPAHLTKCKAKKDAADAAARAKRDRIITQDFDRGDRPKLQSQRFPKRPKQNRASSPLAPKFEGDILSRAKATT